MKVHNIIVSIIVNEDPEWDKSKAKGKILFDPACQVLFRKMRLDKTCEPITLKRRAGDQRLVIVSGHDKWAVASMLRWNSIPANILE